jgi:hypothetical protein
VEGEPGFDQGGYAQQAGRGMGRGMAPGQRMAPQQFGQEVVSWKRNRNRLQI